MDNIPVDHGVPPLIHTLTTLRRERPEMRASRLRRNNNRYFFKYIKDECICRPGLVKMS